MPQEALSRSLLYLFDLMTEEEQSPFECPPWNLPIWRECFGLVPLNNPSGDYVDESADVDGDFSSQASADAKDGFIFSETALKSLSPSKLKVVTDTYTIMRAGSFMQTFWSQWCNHAARKEKITRVIDLVTPDTPLALKNDDTGYCEYRQLLLAAFDRSGGVNSIVDEVLGACRASPVEKWKDKRNTNRRRPLRKREEEHDVKTPTASQAIDSRVLAALARRLFGDTAVDVGGTVVNEFYPTVNCLSLRRFENLARKLETKKGQSKKAMEKVDGCLKACEQPTAANLRAAAEALVAWHRIAAVTLEVEDPLYLKRDEQMASLWAEAGFEYKEKVKRKAKATKPKNSVNIPTDAEMQAAFQYYVEDYCRCIKELEDLPNPELQVPSSWQDSIDDETDIGVAEFKDWPLERVWQFLGLAGARQYPFAEPGTSYAPELGLLDKPAVFPLFHQVVGMTAIIQAAFTSQIGQRALPSLLCDDVGLGKTIQITGVICILRHYSEQQKLVEDKRLSPPEFTFVNGTAYFSGHEHMQNRPSIIIVPQAIGNQWVEQLVKFTQQGSFAIIRYSVDQGSLESFSSNPKGAYRIAAGPNNKRAGSVIIVADMSAISKEAKRCLEPTESFYKGNAARLLEAKGEVAEFREGVSLEGSIMSMHFRVAAVDEIHQVRNTNVTQRGVQRITENSDLVIGATATPLFTSAPNLSSIARVLRYKPLLGQQGVDCYQKVSKSKKAREKDWDVKSAQIIMNTAFEEARHAAGEDEGERFEQLLSLATKKYAGKQAKGALKMSYVSQPAIDIFREVLRPVVIRRTADSKDSEGKPILALPPFRDIIAWSQMRENERILMDRVNAMHERWKEVVARKAKELGEDSPDMLRWRNFLLDQKHCSLHPDILDVREREREMGLKEGDLFHTIVKDWTEHNINEKASSRMLTLDMIIDHYWTGNPKILRFNEDGSKDLEAMVDEPLPSEKPRKFLVYVSLTYHRKLIAKMFDIKKRGYVCYDGSMSAQKRQQALNKFTADDQCRIMIISNVGAAGLNVTAASIVIHVTPVWSGQESRQINGRAFRHGQERDVNAYQIVASDGIDLALLGLSTGKTLTSERFMMSNNKLRQIYQGVTAPAETDNDNDNETERPTEIVSTKGSKVATRKRKQPSADEEEADASGESKPVKRSKPGRSANTASFPTISTTGAALSTPAQTLSATSGNKVTAISRQALGAVSTHDTQRRAKPTSIIGDTSTSTAAAVPGKVASKSATSIKDTPATTAIESQLNPSARRKPKPKPRPAPVQEQLEFGVSSERELEGAGVERDCEELPRPTVDITSTQSANEGSSQQSANAGSSQQSSQALPQSGQISQSQVKFRRPKKAATLVPQPTRTQELAQPIPPPPRSPSTILSKPAQSMEQQQQQRLKSSDSSSKLNPGTNKPAKAPFAAVPHARDIGENQLTALSTNPSHVVVSTAKLPPKVAQPSKVNCANPTSGPSCVSNDRASKDVISLTKQGSDSDPFGGDRVRVTSRGSPRPQSGASWVPLPVLNESGTSAAGKGKSTDKSCAPLPTHPVDKPPIVISSSFLKKRKPPAATQTQETQSQVRFRRPRVMGAPSEPAPALAQGPDTLPLPTASSAPTKAIRSAEAVASRNGQILDSDGK